MPETDPAKSQSATQGKSGSRHSRTPKTPARSSWRPRLVVRKYVEFARPSPARELSVFLEHKGRGHHFPLGSSDLRAAGLVAHKIRQHLLKYGWESTLDRFVHEMTLAVFWMPSPLVATYTTLFSTSASSASCASSASASSTPAPPSQSSASVRVLLVEPDTVARRSIAYWIDQMPGYKCEATAGTVPEAIQLAGKTRVDLILFNRILHGSDAEDPTGQFTQVWSDIPAVPFGNYASSDELFIGITGVSSGYFLRRRVPTQILEPLGTPRIGQRWTKAKGESAARAYFLGLLSNAHPAEENFEIPLTHREREMLEFLSRGFQDKEIAASLGISVWTVHTHMKRTFEKLGVHNRAEAVSRYLQK